MHDGALRHYIHGTARDEQERLAALNALLNESSLAAMPLRPGQRVLDLGCGLGQLTRAIARRVGPDGHVVGVDSREEQLERVGEFGGGEDAPASCELRLGDALDPPLADEEWGSFDLVHARFLLEHLADPEAAVAVMVRAARSGGRVVLEDDDHALLTLDPPVPAFEVAWRAYCKAYAALGCDPRVGRRLVSLLRRGGARPVSTTWLFFGACAGHESFRPLVENFLHIVDGARECILGTESASAAELDEGLEALASWCARPDASLGYARCHAIGARSPAADVRRG